MFERKKCRRCGEALKDMWNFCPECGDNASKSFDMEDSMEKDFQNVQKMMGMDVLGFPKIGMPKAGGRGISITIRNVPGRPPQIEVNTSGERREDGREMSRMLAAGHSAGEGVKEAVRRRLNAPKIIKEPQTKVNNAGKVQTITISLPGVKSRKDVEIKRLEQSIEVKAFAGDKAYFKLIPVASNSQISSTDFNSGLLKIEVKR